MFIKLLPTQIPKNWEIIKFAAINADRIASSDWTLYLNRLLHALMAGKAQCFFRIDQESREVTALSITRLVMDEVTGEKTLFINCVYSFKSASGKRWAADFNVLKEFAVKEKCKKITTYSNNSRVFEIVEALGFEERYKCYVMEV